MKFKNLFLILIVLWLFTITMFNVTNSKNFYQDAYSIRMTNVNWSIIENGNGEDIKELKVKLKNHQVCVKITLWNNKTLERTYERNKLIYVDYI